jgi:quinol monooxygenase YgiN
MLIIAGTLQVEPTQRDRYLDGMKDFMQSSRSEPGCIDYALSPDTLDDGLVRVFEVWDSKAALAAHLEEFAARPPGDAEPLAVDVVQYEISGTGPLGS